MEDHVQPLPGRTRGAARSRSTTGLLLVDHWHLRSGTGRLRPQAAGRSAVPAYKDYRRAAGHQLRRVGALPLRSPSWPILAAGNLEIVRPVSGEPVSPVAKKGLLPDVDPRAPAPTGAKGTQGGGLGEGTGVGQASEKG